MQTQNIENNNEQKKQQDEDLLSPINKHINNVAKKFREKKLAEYEQNKNKIKHLIVKLGSYAMERNSLENEILLFDEEIKD